jgi:hypothetical protein
MMTAVPRILLTIVAAAFYTLLTGFLLVRADAVENGFSLSWTDLPYALEGGGSSAWLQRIAVAGLAAMVVAIVWRLRTHRDVAFATAGTLIAVAVFYMLTTDQPYGGAIESAMAAATSNSGASGYTILEPSLLAWLRTGGLSSAIHVVAAVCTLVPFTRESSVVSSNTSDSTPSM